MTGYIKSISIILLVLALQSCYFMQPTRAPIEMIHYKIAASQERPKDLIVLLPGIKDYAEAFQQHAFIDEIRAHDLPVDAVAVNAHLGYYSNRSLLQRLRQDVIEPARQQGYERIHFVGISLGGYGTLLYMREYPEDVSSAVLLAPYLGETSHYRHLLDHEAEPILAEENIWPWLQSLEEGELAKLYLGYGRADQYAEGHQLLSSLLPGENSTSIRGGHNWSTWQSLWPALLAQAQGLDAEVLAEL